MKCQHKITSYIYIVSTEATPEWTWGITVSR